MKRSTLTYVWFAVSAACVLLLSAVPQSASAQAGANVVKVSPVRSDLSGKQGETVKVSTFVTNVTKDPTVYKVVVNDFIAGDESGSPSLILDENSYAPTHSLKRFIGNVPNVTVAPGQTAQVDVAVKVPADAKAGGYFGAIRFIPSTSKAGMVNFNASATSLVLFTVPGDLIENLNLQSFEVQQRGSIASNFRSPDDLELLMRFENTGNVQVAPYGKISVLKDEKVVYSTNFNGDQPRSSVLPDSKRKWTIPLKNFGKFGKYTVKATLSYGTTNKSIEVEKTVWIVPTMYIIFAGVGLLILLLIIGLIIALVRAKRASRNNSRRYYT